MFIMCWILILSPYQKLELKSFKATPKKIKGTWKYMINVN